nr:cytochrome c oxidase assembly protein [Brachybacterium sp. ACRRE]
MANFFRLELPTVPVIPIIAASIGLMYIAGWIAMIFSGRGWAAWRGAAFLLGTLILVGMTGLAVEGYGYAMFSVFMFQQMTFMLTIPPLLLLGKPGTLLLRATPHNWWGQPILRIALFGLRSRFGKLLTHPLFTLPLFLFLFYGLYLANVASRFLSSTTGHLVLELLFLVCGILFNLTLVPGDPLPSRTSYLSRVLDAFFEAGLFAFFGVLVMMAPAPLVSAFTSAPEAWGVDTMKDQYLAGGISWAYGELPSLLVLLIVMIAWARSDERLNRVRDRQVARQGDVELDAYNEYLRSLK